MQSPTSSPALPGSEREYLCVDEFLRDFLSVQALATAFTLELIDLLAERQVVRVSELHGDVRGLRLLLDVLRSSSVVEENGGEITLSDRFRRALQFRDLLEAKIEFANIAAVDFLQHFPALVVEPGAFMASAGMFRLFDYGRAWERTPENEEATRRWMRLTTALTRYEAGVCLARFPFAKHRRMLEIGGNSGEFALQVCQQHPQIEATVFDLPVVCDVGRKHVQGKPGSERVQFVAGDARRDPLPEGCDLVAFKSMLHDWPDEDAARFLNRANAVLEPGGAVLIFERDRVEVGREPLPFGALPLVVFAGAYRGPEFYVAALQALGFIEIRVERVELELPFFLLSAVKPPTEDPHSQVRWTQ